MSQHPIENLSAPASEIATVLGELLINISDQLHTAARLAMLSRDLVESTSLQTGDPQIRQRMDDLVERLSAQTQADIAAISAPPRSQYGRREMVLDLYATTDLPLADIARRAGVDTDTPRRILRRMRADGDRRAAQGDLRRQQAADQAAPLQNSARSPHDGLPESAGKASPDQPVEEGATSQDPAQGEEVVPTSRAGEELTTSDDPAPAPEPIIVGVDMGSTPDRMGVFARKDDGALVEVRLPTEMELADELSDEPAVVSRTRRNEEQIARIAAAAKRVAAKAEATPKRGPAGVAQRAAARVERAPEPETPPASTVRRIVPTEEEIGLPILHVDRKAKTITGPIAVWGDCSTILLAVAERLADGRLYGHEKVQEIAGFKKWETFRIVWEGWKRQFEDIGVGVYDEKGYGVRLSRTETA